MGIFDKKQDDVQTITPDSSATPSSTDTPVVTEPVSVSTPVDTTDTTSNTDTTSSSTASTAPTLDELEKTESSSSATVDVTGSTESLVDSSAEEAPSINNEVAPISDLVNSEVAQETPSVEVEPDITSEPTPVLPSASRIEIKPIEVQTYTAADSNSSSGDLTDIKREAIEQLSPLVELLDQTPEEKFHTTMMLLQSTDNKDLIKKAYDVAQQIPDDKIKAQALLDVVNEINYYTQEQPAQ